jgi:hypothetical protein
VALKSRLEELHVRLAHLKQYACGS